MIEFELLMTIPCICPCFRLISDYSGKMKKGIIDLFNILLFPFFFFFFSDSIRDVPLKHSKILSTWLYVGIIKVASIFFQKYNVSINLLKLRSKIRNCKYLKRRYRFTMENLKFIEKSSLKIRKIFSSKEDEEIIFTIRNSHGESLSTLKTSIVTNYNFKNNCNNFTNLMRNLKNHLNQNSKVFEKSEKKHVNYQTLSNSSIAHILRDKLLLSRQFD